MKVQLKPGIHCTNCNSIVKRVIGIRVDAEDDETVSYLVRCDNCKTKMHLKSVLKKTGEWIFLTNKEKSYE